MERTSLRDMIVHVAKLAILRWRYFSSLDVKYTAFQRSFEKVLKEQYFKERNSIPTQPEAAHLGFEPLKHGSLTLIDHGPLDPTTKTMARTTWSTDDLTKPNYGPRDH